MPKHPTKTELRRQLSEEIENYLGHGGQVLEVPRGATGLVDGRYGHAIGFEKPREQRTDLTDVLNTIDQRKELQRSPAARPRPHKPKKKIIYDDFGEPVRVVWE